jgi:hypothetical protein
MFFPPVSGRIPHLTHRTASLIVTTTPSLRHLHARLTASNPTPPLPRPAAPKMLSSPIPILSIVSSSISYILCSLYCSFFSSIPQGPESPELPIASPRSLPCRLSLPLSLARSLAERSGVVPSLRRSLPKRRRELTRIKLAG